jgi:uncharacterized protein YbjT (DUF2867 family)
MPLLSPTKVLVLTIITLHLIVFCNGSVLVLGATGRTGSLVYQQLKQRGIQNVRALVRSLEKAKDILGCHSCDETEGIYVGDVRNLTSLLPALKGVSTVAIASGAGPNTTIEDIKAIEFLGVQNAVKGLAQDHNQDQFGGIENLRVVLCSSMGTTTMPHDHDHDHGVFETILFQKLNAEAFLGSVGMVTSIVKPCGLSSTAAAGENATLLASHDDAPTPTGSRMIPRADVARVMSELVVRKPHQNLRFDLCSIEGPVTTNLGELIDSAKWPWEQGTRSTSSARPPSSRQHTTSVVQTTILNMLRYKIF